MLFSSLSCFNAVGWMCCSWEYTKEHSFLCSTNWPSLFYEHMKCMLYIMCREELRGSEKREMKKKKERNESEKERDMKERTTERMKERNERETIRDKSWNRERKRGTKERTYREIKIRNAKYEREMRELIEREKS